MVAAKTVAMHAHKVAVLLASAAYAKLTGNSTRANAAMKLLNQTMKMNPWGLLAAAIVAAGTALALYIKKQHELTLADKTLNDIRSEAAKRVGEETSRINILVQAAQNEKLSLDQRQEAIRQLNQLIPGYNAQLDETTGKYTANKAALDAYLQSLAKQYELEGAKAKLQELGAKKADITLKKQDAEAELAQKKNLAENINSQQLTGTTSYGATFSSVASGNAETAVLLAQNRVDKFADELREIAEAEKKIFDIYGEQMGAEAVSAPTPTTVNTPTITAPTASPNDGKAAKNKFQAEDDWKEEQEALNRIAYAKGEEDYDAYVKRMLQIQVDYNQKKLQHTDLVGSTLR